MRVGIKNEMEWRMEVKGMSDEVLGKLVREYMDDSMENNWEGFSDGDKVGIRKLLGDMVLYYENGGVE